MTLPPDPSAADTAPAPRAAGRRRPPPERSEPDGAAGPSPAPSGFYDGLAAIYHLIYPDWEAARRNQARIFAELLAAEGLAPGAELLDCAAGIGTQALGLAEAGYRVTATDASPAALRRLAREARALQLHLPARACDIRDLAAMVRNPRDAALAVDNALPHFLSDHQLILALRAIAACLRPGGLLLLSMRDYDGFLDDERPHRERPLGEGPFVHEAVPPRRILYQVWDWQDARIYDAHLYITWRDAPQEPEPAARRPDEGWRVHHGVTRYRALRRAELARAARAAGFVGSTWLMPQDTGFYQPLMLARRQ